MKRGIIIGLAVYMTLILVSFILNTYLKKQRNFGKYKTMKYFSFSTLYNEVKNTSTRPKYKGYVVQIFSTECGICKDEANEYHNHCFCKLAEPISVYRIEILGAAMVLIGNFLVNKKMFKRKLDFSHTDYFPSTMFDLFNNCK